MRMTSTRVTACVAAVLGLVLLCEPLRSFDVILDVAQVNQLLTEIGQFYGRSESAPKAEERADALYEMGERCLDLADLMSRDKESHGAVDANLAAVIDRRLKTFGLNFVVDPLGYHYDLAAFRQYLRDAPNGDRAADAWYALIGFDEPGDNIPGLLKSIEAKNDFIRRYPQYSEMSIVKLLLAQQHTRLAALYSSQKNPAQAKEQKAAQDIYREIVKRFPQSPEAETAAGSLVQGGTPK
jgi:hypothetical protein